MQKVTKYHIDDDDDDDNNNNDNDDENLDKVNIAKLLKG